MTSPGEITSRHFFAKQPVMALVYRTGIPRSHRCGSNPPSRPTDMCFCCVHNGATIIWTTHPGIFTFPKHVLSDTTLLLVVIRGLVAAHRVIGASGHGTSNEAITASSSPQAAAKTSSEKKAALRRCRARKYSYRFMAARMPRASKCNVCSRQPADWSWL